MLCQQSNRLYKKYASGSEGTTLIVEGSLTKWFWVIIMRTLALWEIRAAIKSLSKALNVPIEKAKVTRIDVAFNF